MEKIEECIRKDLKAPKKECSGYREYFDENGKKVRGKETIRRYLKQFLDFKEKLLSGESLLLNYVENGADDQKIEIISQIMEFEESIRTPHGRDYVKCNVEVDPALKKMARKLSRSIEPETADIGFEIMDILNNAYWQSLSQGDSYYDAKQFVLVRTKREFEELLKKGHAEDYTKIFNWKNVRCGFYPVSLNEAFKEKGIYEDYLEYMRRKLRKPGNVDSTCFSLWHGVTSRAVIFFYFGDNDKK